MSWTTDNPGPPRMVEVEWVDSLGHREWASPRVIEESLTATRMLHRTVGYVIRDDDDGLLVCASVSVNDEKMGDCSLIPRPAVLKVAEVAALNSKLTEADFRDVTAEVRLAPGVGWHDLRERVNGHPKMLFLRFIEGQSVSDSGRPQAPTNPAR